MSRKPGAIVDLDGTLYRLRGEDGTFNRSDFSRSIKEKMSGYLAFRLDVSEDEAQDEIAKLRSKFNGAVSVGVEREFGIDRYEWFGNTWNLNPADYIETPPVGLAEALEPISDRAVILTAAPGVWAYPALEYLGLDEIFNGRVFTGEPDIRKPNPAVFCKAAVALGRTCREVVSIGDQIESDILPARALGMTTIKVGLPIPEADYSAQDIQDAVAILSNL